MGIFSLVFTLTRDALLGVWNSPMRDFIRNLPAGIGTEMTADAAEQWVGKLYARVKELYHDRKIQNQLQDHPDITIDEETLNTIFQEIQVESGKKATRRRGVFSNLKKLTDDCLSPEEFLNKLQLSDTYGQLDAAQRRKMADVLLTMRRLVLEYRCKNMADDETRWIINALANEIQEKYEHTGEKIDELRGMIESVFARTISEDGRISCEHIRLEKYPAKYLPLVCPHCGYDGRFVHIDEATSYIQCGACGQRAQIIRAVEDEAYRKLGEKIDQSALRQVEQYEQLQDCYAELSELLENRVTNEYLKACLDGKEASFLKRTTEIHALLERRADELIALVKDMDRTQATEIKQIMQEQADNDEIANRVLRRHLDSLGAQIDMLYHYAQEAFAGADVKLETILHYVENQCSKEYFEERTKALGSDMQEVYRCTTRYFDDTFTEYRNQQERAMTELNADVQMILQFHRDQVSQCALTNASMAQIISAIQELADKYCDDQTRRAQLVAQADSGGGDEDIYSPLEERLQEESTLICGQLSGLRLLIEDSKAENAKYCRDIIRSQEEQTAILLARLSDRKDDQIVKIYQGKIPSKYLVNEGFGGAFFCPYCGVEAERVVNNDQYCQCHVCGQRFYHVRMDAADELCGEYGFSKTDDKMPTRERVDEWRGARTAICTEVRKNHTVQYEVKVPAKSRNGILFLPEELLDCNGTLRKIQPSDELWSIRVLVFPPRMTSFDQHHFFGHMSELEAIVISPYSDNGKMKFLFRNTRISTGRANVLVYGKTVNGKDIKAE